MRLTTQIDDPNWSDIHARDARIARLQKQLRAAREALRVQLSGRPVFRGQPRCEVLQAITEPLLDQYIAAVAARGGAGVAAGKR